MSRNSSEPVVITGIGVISPVGQSVDELLQAMTSGRSGIGPLRGAHCRGLPVSAGGEVSEFTGRIEDFGDLPAEKKKAIRKGLKVMCREIQMGVAAAQRALQASGLENFDLDPDRTGVVYGSDYITTVPEEFQLAVEHCLDERRDFDFGRWGAHGIPQISPLWLLKYLPNMPACHVAIYNDLRGANNSITVREASSNLALGESLSTLRRGIVDRVVAGATGSRLHPLRSLHILLQEEVAEPAMATAGAPSDRSLDATALQAASRPFDRHRSGMVLGEGAAAMTLETASAADARGAECWGRMLGWGSSSVATRDGGARQTTALVNAMRMALAQSGLTVDQIGHVHAHGVGTVLGDQAEGRAIDTVFAGRSEPIPVVAAKSSFGNLGAGSGMVELAVSLLALRRGELFPILNLDEPDESCFGDLRRVRLVTTRDVPAGRSVLNISVTPGGQASAVVVGL